MATFQTSLTPSEKSLLTPNFGFTPEVMASSSGAIRVWWLRAVIVVTMGYVVASQALSSFSGWSRLGFGFAAMLSLLLLLGCLLGIARLNLGSWFWIPVVFVGYCFTRAIPETGDDWPWDALFGLITAFLGGIGASVALQQGMPFKALVYAQIASSLCSIVAGLFGIGTEQPAGSTEVRYAGLTGNANELGLQLTVGACLIWFLPRKAGAVACSFAVAAVAYAILTTGSRKVLFVLPVFLVLVFIQVWTALRGHRVLLAFAGGVTLCLAGAILAPTILERGNEITAIHRTLEYEDSSFDGRVDMAYQATRLWHDAPLLGNGTDAFRRLSVYGTYAHNNYAELLCDTGLLGVLLFYAIHAYILFKCWRLPGPVRLYCWLFVLLLLALDMGYVSYTRKQTAMVLMVLAGMVGSRHQAWQAAGGSLRERPAARSATFSGAARLPV